MRGHLSGSSLHSKEGTELQQWYHREWTDYDAVKDATTDITAIKKALEDAVHRQLMSDVPYGVLLSGGLDSSLTAAIAKKFAEKRIESGDAERAWYPQLHSFAIGLEGSPDLKASRKVADQIGTVHHEVHFTIQEGLDAVRDVIYFLETYDITTIRASIGMYLVCKAIHETTDIRVLLTGEISDELFGYKYTDFAPSAEEFQKEAVKRVRELHMYDVLRADRCISVNSLEARVPFADHRIIEYVWNVPWSMKCRDGVVKALLRKSGEGKLPKEVLWRRKSPYPKTYHPDYEAMLGARLLEVLADPGAPIRQLVDKKKAEKFVESPSDYGKPWYGQLMAGPQMLAYMLQVNYWLEKYQVRILL